MASEKNLRNGRIAVALLLVVICLCVFLSGLYVRTGRIVGVEYDNDLIVIRDLAGITWTWKGAEDWTCGEYVSMLIWDSLSPLSILDDVILQVR